MSYHTHTYKVYIRHKSKLTIVHVSAASMDQVKHKVAARWHGATIIKVVLAQSLKEAKKVA